MPYEFRWKYPEVASGIWHKDITVGALIMGVVIFGTVVLGSLVGAFALLLLIFEE